MNHRRVKRTLGIVAVIEAVTLLVLVLNLVTVHLPGVAAALGPVHGSAYLVAIALALSGPFSTRARMLTFVPGVGALVAAWWPPAAARAPDDGSRPGEAV